MAKMNEDLSLNKLKLLIRTRLDLESEFVSGRKKKSFLWGKVHERMLKVYPDLEMTREQISRKFLNLVTTYKRIKVRNSSTGVNATSWEFFDDFEEVYGTRYSFSPPIENIQSSLKLSLRTESSLSESTNKEETNEESNFPRSSKHRKLTCNDSMLQFLKVESKREQARHEEVMKLERERLKVEKVRVQTLAEIKNFLQQYLRK